MIDARLRLVMVLGLAACGGDQPRPASPTSARSGATIANPVAPDAGVTIGVALEISPSDADIDLDGEPRGAASAQPPVLPLEPGVHQLIVTRAGYKAYRVEFIVSDRIEHFVVSLERAAR